MITVAGLTRRFGPVTAIEDLSFHLERGEVVGFLGPNGAGKTTTMRILTGYLPATSGRAEIAGLDVLRKSLEVRKKIGYLPEAVPLYREHRVVEMLEFQARLHGMRRADWRVRIPEVLERVGIAHRSRSLIGGLSRGQRQRVGIAVALLPSPEVLILDEPTSGLDPLQRIEVRGLLRELADEHTVLISSHILPEIEAVCPRVIVLNDGRIAADGTQEELVHQLGGASHVHLEAVVGDAAEALRLLGTIRGVGGVLDRGKVGIHHAFDLPCAETLCEDVGALAAQKGWALRELLGLDQERADAPSRPAAAPAPASAGVSAGELPVIATPSTAGGGERVGKRVYNLNPFDQGAGRDLGAPKLIESEPPPAARKREEEREEGRQA